MVKCKKCGTEFEGKFCPECGTKYEGKKTCPKCGFEVAINQKFCNNCGHNFFEQEVSNISESKIEVVKEKTAKEKKNLDSIKLFSSILRYTPAVLFGLFALLIWIFFAQPIATIFGKSIGNIYELMKGSELINPIKELIIVIVFGVLTFAMLGSLIFSILKLNKKYIRINKFYVTLSDLMAYISQIFYLIFLIIGIIINVKVSKEGAIVGSCSSLLISFSIIFLIISLGCFIGIKIFYKKFNLQDSNESIELIEKKKEKEIVEPKPIDKIEKPDLIEVKIYRVMRYVKIIMPLIYSFIFTWIDINLLFPTVNYLVSIGINISIVIIIGSLMFIISTLIISIFFFLSFRKIKKYSCKTYKKQLFKTIFANVLFLFLPVLVFILSKLARFGIIYRESYNLFIEALYTMPNNIQNVIGIPFELAIKIFYNPMIFAIIGLVLIISVYLCLRVIKRYFWNGKVKKNTSMKITFDEFLLKRKKAKEDYKLYQKNQPKYSMYLLKKEEFDNKKKINPLKKLICSLKSICLVHTSFIIVVILIIGACFGIKGFVDNQNNIFRAGKLDKFSIGWTTQEDVVQTLGEPDKENESEYEYFGNEYKKINEKLEKLQYKIENITDLDQLFKLEKESEKLEKQLKELSFKHISISFEGDKISEIVYDTQYSLTKDSSNKKETSLILVLNTSYSWIEPKIYYKDGSYRSYEITPYCDFYENNNRYYNHLSWSDSWGSYSYYAQIKNEFYYNGVKTRIDYLEDEYGNYIVEATITGNGIWNDPDVGDIPFDSIDILNLGPNVTFSPDYSSFDDDLYIPNLKNLKEIKFVEGYSNYFSIKELVNTNDKKFKYLANKEGNQIITFIDHINGNVIIPNCIMSINSKAFYYEEIESVYIPRSVQNIGFRPFPDDCICYCEFEFGKQPSGWDWSGDYFKGSDYRGNVVWGCSIEDFNAEINNETNKLLDFTLYRGEINGFLVSANELGKEAESIIVPEYFRGKPVIGIYPGGFKDCRNLNQITLPNSIIVICFSAFENCTSLSSISLPNSVASIEEYAFSECISMHSIFIPNSVIYIGYSAFQYCSVVFCEASSEPSDWDSNWNESISYGGKVYWGVELGGCPIEQNGLLYLIINGSALLGGYSDEMTNNVVIPSTIIVNETIYNVTGIGLNAFSGCSSLTSVVIPSSITSIEEYVFCGCSSLTIYCEASSKPSGWNQYWRSLEEDSLYYQVTVYWAGEWSYVDDVPIPNN